MTSVYQRAVAGTARLSAIASWVVLAVGLSTVALVRSQDPSAAQSILTLSLAVFFLILLVRLGTSAILNPARRARLIVLLVSVALWAAGSAVLNAAEVPDLLKFPAPGEWLFLAAYLGMAAYLIIDTVHRTTNGLATWLETVVICGGTVCLAGVVLLTPFAVRFGRDGLPLLVALLYPLIDAALGTLVIGQVVMRSRAGLRQSWPLILGFALFTYADTAIVTHLTSSAYSFSVLDDTCYGLGFALIISQACRPTRDEPVTKSRREGPLLMLAAGVVALIVLVLHQPGQLGPYLIVPALVTLTAAGGRLTVALREANAAAEAFALARSDDLTQLPNRRAVLALVDERLAARLPLGFMLIDLDGFKDVNDTLGHAAGDAVLQMIATRIRAALATEIMVARLGGDEFAIVAPLDDALCAMELAQVVLAQVREPLTVDGIRLSTDASIGVALRLASDTSSSELLRRADVAMYQAKLTRAGALLYDAHHDHFSREKLRIADELRKAIAEHQLMLWYQPQIEASTQRICGLEALVRWQHPTEGVLSPALFLPAARRAGLMLALSNEVVRLAIADLKHWRSVGLHPRVALNCAPPELMSGMFLPDLFRALDEAEVPAESLIIEVTEDSFINDPDRARAVLHDIRSHNVQISIDDYGTGFSSLSYLRDLPVQELKIDRSFVAAMLDDPRSRMIIASTLQLAKALGLRSVAEGVENAETAADLVALGVDVLQGYYLSRPLPPEEVEAFIPRWKSFTDVTYGGSSRTSR